jgi:hypothetical protein
MSLVVAFAGKKKAIVGGDRRSIAFFGQAEALEEELYSGQIKSDEQLVKRAQELKAQIAVSDARDKVWAKGHILVGEVAELSADDQRRRRVYAAPGGYLLVDISKNRAEIRQQGKSTLIILGNEITKKVAYEQLAKLEAFDESIIESTFKEAREKTASVSPTFKVISSSNISPDPMAALRQALFQDCEENGWKVSSPQ